MIRSNFPVGTEGRECGNDKIVALKKKGPLLKGSQHFFPLPCVDHREPYLVV
jgi:hypothetical protein